MVRGGEERGWRVLKGGDKPKQQALAVVGVMGAASAPRGAQPDRASARTRVTGVEEDNVHAVERGKGR